MPITPIINSGTAPQVRRPRPTISESEAVSGPFAVSLVCSEEGKYRPGPNVLMVHSSRLAVTASPEAPTVYPWGVDYEYAGDVPSAGVEVGYLWIKSLDANGDGLDDLESAGSVTLADCFATYGDGLLSMDDNPIAGVGNIGLSGSGLIVNVAPVAGVGSLGISGAGALGFAGIEPQPIAAVSGGMTFSGTGALGVVSSGSLTGTYYLRNQERAGGIAGDRELGTSNTAAYAEMVTGGAPLGQYAQVRLVVLNASGGVARTVRDWYSIGAALPDVDEVAYRTAALPAFENPAVAAGEFFAIQVRTSLASVVSPFFTLPAGENPGAQSGAVVHVYAYNAYDGEDTPASIYWGNATFPSRIVFSGA